MYTLNNIVFVPDTDTIQTVIKFPYKGNDRYTVLSYQTADHPTLTTDVKALQMDNTFVGLVNEAITAEKKNIDNPTL